MNLTHSIPALSASAMLTIGCNSGLGPGTLGELGNGQFTYICDSHADPLCNDGEDLHALPKAVALGSRFTVKYFPALDAEDRGSATVVSASDEMLIETETLASSFKALRRGTAALLAVRAQTVMDLVHVRIVPVDHVQVDGRRGGAELRGVTSVTLSPGEILTLRAFAADATGAALAGALSCSWTHSDSKVAEAGTVTSGNELTLKALQEGTTTAKVTLDEHAVEVVVTVVAAGSNG